MLFVMTVDALGGGEGRARSGGDGLGRQRRAVRFPVRSAALFVGGYRRQYLLTFAVMLAVSLIVGHLTAGLRSQAREADRREQAPARSTIWRETGWRDVRRQVDEGGRGFLEDQCAPAAGC